MCEIQRKAEAPESKGEVRDSSGHNQAQTPRIPQRSNICVSYTRTFDDAPMLGGACFRNASSKFGTRGCPDSLRDPMYDYWQPELQTGGSTKIVYRRNIEVTTYVSCLSFVLRAGSCFYHKVMRNLLLSIADSLTLRECVDVHALDCIRSRKQPEEEDVGRYPPLPSTRDRLFEDEISFLGEDPKEHPFPLYFLTGPLGRDYESMSEGRRQQLMTENAKQVAPPFLCRFFRHILRSGNVSLLSSLGHSIPRANLPS